MLERHRIIIVGGGFAGLYAALEFEKILPSRPDLEVTLVNQENFFLFTPMLHEVAAGDLDPNNIVNPIRKLLKHVSFFEGTVLSIDLGEQIVRVQHGFDGHSHDLRYNQLVVAAGSTTHFFDLPGVEEHAYTMKSLSDAARLRSRLIALLEEANTDCAANERTDLLSLAVVGAGFAGVETLASINDFLRHSLRFYRSLSEAQLQITLIHPGDLVLPELNVGLRHYAQQKLAARGVRILPQSRVVAYDGRTIQLADGNTLTARTLLWTAGTMPHPLVATLPCIKERGRLRVSAFLSLEDWPGVWALGDCAIIPDLSNGKVCPPTAQHALRQGKVVARNAVAFVDGRRQREFRFASPGQLASIGTRVGVASLFGMHFSGFSAWWLWRTIYLSKLPRFEKKMRVALDWTLDLLFSKDLCRFVDQHPPTPGSLKLRSTAQREEFFGIRQ